MLLISGPCASWSVTQLRALGLQIVGLRDGLRPEPVWVMDTAAVCPLLRLNLAALNCAAMRFIHACFVLALCTTIVRGGSDDGDGAGAGVVT